MTLVFGYMNQNWVEEFDIPIGPDNNIEPGGPDRGQPTHFYPRRSPFLFTIKVPKDFGDKELIWTLKTHGKIEKAYASLKNDYMIDNQVISTEVGGDFGSLRDELRTNIPPELKVEGEKKRTVKVGAPLTLTAIARDPDNIPRAPRARRVAADGDARGGAVSRAVVARAGERTGPAAVVDRLPRQGGRRHVQPGADEDVDRHARLRATRRGRRRTSSPSRRRTTSGSREVTFKEPGTYVLRAVASDGAVFTYDNVTVTVTR